ncbi:Uncharacterised protein [Mycobacterium tuberculosis]|uniref:Uncharacterized protein n=1 Tax=Mycobacterium tuberculosis TaxID=1773 RepID=A0A655AX60_MYCTX|nr:Uncharacterised protein [Mycobacterium tuberculosis]
MTDNIINSSTDGTTCIEHIIHQDNFAVCHIDRNQRSIFSTFNIITERFSIQFHNRN